MPTITDRFAVTGLVLVVIALLAFLNERRIARRKMGG